MKIESLRDAIKRMNPGDRFKFGIGGDELTMGEAGELYECDGLPIAAVNLIDFLPHTGMIVQKEPVVLSAEPMTFEEWFKVNSYAVQINHINLPQNGSIQLRDILRKCHEWTVASEKLKQPEKCDHVWLSHGTGVTCSKCSTKVPF